MSTPGVVIDVKATGICRFDWHAWRGHEVVPLPHVPGPRGRIAASLSQTAWRTQMPYAASLAVAAGAYVKS